MYNTVIFDLDGTLLDTLYDLYKSVNYALEKHHLKTHSIDEIRRFLGRGMEMLIALSIDGGKNHPLFDEIYHEFKSYYLIHGNDSTKFYDGIKELLDALKSLGYKMAIVSNKADSAVKKFYETYFLDYVDVAIGEKTNVRKKPYPDTVIEAMRILNKKPNECIFVGDSEVDIETAKNAGIECISCSWGFRSVRDLVESGAKIIVNKPLEILDILKNK